MNYETSAGAPLSAGLIQNYFRNLVNQIYKILPMRENGTPSVGKYIWRLEAELIGEQSLVSEFREDAYFGSLVGILQYLNEHMHECSIDQVKQLVFEGISICGKLQDRYGNAGDKDGRMESI